MERYINHNYTEDSLGKNGLSIAGINSICNGKYCHITYFYSKPTSYYLATLTLKPRKVPLTNEQWVARVKQIQIAAIEEQLESMTIKTQSDAEKHNHLVELKAQIEYGR